MKKLLLASSFLFLAFAANAQFSPPPSGGGNGTVTSVTCGTGLTGGTITTSGTCAVSYGASSGTAAAGNDSRLSVFGPTTNGLVPAPGGSGTTNFLREDGAWQQPAGTTTFVSEICATWDSATTVTTARINVSLPWAATVIKTMTGTSGTGSPAFNSNVLIGATPVGSCSGAAVTTTNTTTTCASPNYGNAGTVITLYASSITGTPNQAYICALVSHGAT